MAALELGAQHIHPTHTCRPDLAPSALTHLCVHRVLAQAPRRGGLRRTAPHESRQMDGGATGGGATGGGTMGDGLGGLTGGGAT